MESSPGRGGGQLTLAARNIENLGFQRSKFTVGPRLFLNSRQILINMLLTTRSQYMLFETLPNFDCTNLNFITFNHMGFFCNMLTYYTILEDL